MDFQKDVIEKSKEIPIVVDPDFGNDKARLAVPDPAIPNPDFAHAALPP